MSQSQIKGTLQRARNIHRQLKTSSQLLENKLDYIREKVTAKSSFLPCGGCTSNKSQISTSFRRAFSNFTDKQKADFYLKYVSIIREALDYAPLDPPDAEPIKNSIYFFNEGEKVWQTRQIELNPVTKVMTFKSTKEQIDLHNYIIRASKKKDRESLALESIEGFQMPQIMRISNNRMSFEEFRQFIGEFVDRALRQSVVNVLRTDRRTAGRGDSLRLSKKGGKQSIKQIKSLEKLSDLPDFALNKPKLEPLQGKTEGKEKAQLDRNSLKDSKTKPISEYERLKQKLINSLTNNAGMQQFRRNVLFDLKENRIRKLYEFKRQDNDLPMQWFEDNLMICSTFRRWKKSLKSAKLFSPQANRSMKVFCEKHKFKNNAQIGYTYKRQRIVSSNNVLYFLDTPPEHNEYYEPTNGAVEYCIWKFERSSNMISIVIEGKVIHDGVRLGYPTLQLTDEFIGEMDYICSNVNMTLLNDTDLNINSVLFEEQYLEQIDRFEDVEELSEFYTIKDDSDDDIKAPEVGFLKSISNMFDKIKKAVTFDEALKLPTAKNRLKFMHPNSPYQKMTAKYRLPLKKGQNPYWQGEWQFNNEGEMISVNEQKLKAQNGVLKSIVKSLAKNVFSGKSILSMSLPVLVFSKDSNLSLLCKSYAYAPLLLERAAKQKDPVQRLKHIVAFGISCNVAYIQMDKPFNPILGQTFQLLIDGCPVLGEQTSHHPPISSTFMKGRGYTLYGNFQAKVNMGINSATGSNDGYVHISFDENDYDKDVVKFNFPPGQLSGLTFGVRKLCAVQKSYYIDAGNMLFLQLNFSKHKGSTEYCKYFDGIEGKIVELLPGTDLSQPEKISKKSIKRECGTICGRWTREIFYEDQPIFDSWTDFPFMCEEYPCPLESDAFYRKDLRLKCDNDLQAAQTAKQELQEIQRNDRKLRKKFTGKEH